MQKEIKRISGFPLILGVGEFKVFGDLKQDVFIFVDDFDSDYIKNGVGVGHAFISKCELITALIRERDFMVSIIEQIRMRGLFRTAFEYERKIKVYWTLISFFKCFRNTYG